MYFVLQTALQNRFLSSYTDVVHFFTLFGGILSPFSVVYESAISLVYFVRKTKERYNWFPWDELLLSNIDLKFHELY